MTRIGDNPPRPDGRAKVDGTARYTDDLAMPGMLHGATVRSPHPRATIESIRWNEALAPAGAIFACASDLTSANGVLLLDDTWPILARDAVHHVGQAVALVAAESREDARRALGAVEVRYRETIPCLTWDEALRQEPLAVRDLSSGDLDRAFGDADLIVEGSYHTGPQEHVYIECQSMLTWFEGETLQVVGSMQCPYYVQKALVHALGLAPERVRVRPAEIGGGFGGKEDYPSLLACHAALLSRISGRPVKITYGRQEDIQATTKRHPAWIRHRTAVRRDGTLLGAEIDVLLDGGAFRTLSPVVLSRAVLHAAGPYRLPAARIRGRVVRTNTTPSGAFRGFGAPQVQFAAERQMDRIARASGIDPYEIRARNVLVPGDRLPTGQVLDASAAGRLCLEEAEALTGFRDRWRRNGGSGRGVGLALSFHGAGFTGSGERNMASPVTVCLAEDGRIEIRTAMTDMGQGARTVLPQIAADAAGVTLDAIHCPDADTAIAPDSGPTVASRTTMIVGGTLARAVRELSAEVRARWRARAGEGAIEPPFLEMARSVRGDAGALERTVHHTPPPWQEFDDATYQGVAYATYGWAAHVVHVDVDPDTLETQPAGVTVVAEVGRVVHPVLCRGQIEGGTLQALGWAYLEEMQVERGRISNDRLQTYIIPTIQDAPPLEVHLLERPWEGGPGGAKGVGELPMDGGAPALVQAIENATGLAADRIPVLPEHLLDHAEQRGART